jgi:hypothetical protein
VAFPTFWRLGGQAYVLHRAQMASCTLNTALPRSISVAIHPQILVIVKIANEAPHWAARWQSRFEVDYGIQLWLQETIVLRYTSQTLMNNSLFRGTWDKEQLCRLIILRAYE